MAEPTAQAKTKKTPPTEKKHSPHATVVIGGGAPNSPLMAGALAAIYDDGKTFDHFFTSGAGGLIGLLYVAPRGNIPTSQALQAVVASSISDEIYRFVPLGYKTFFKPGPFTKPMHRFAGLFKYRDVLPLDPKDKEEARRNRLKRLYNDSVDLWASILTPTWISYYDRGVCPPFPFTNELVDFQKLREFKGTFQLNAYNLEKGRSEQFRKRQLSEPEFAAAFAFPFVYKPVQINGVYYSEGADHDPLNLPQLHNFLGLRRGGGRGGGPEEDPPVQGHSVVLLDVLGSMAKALVRVPRNLLDAYGVQIMTPVVSLAQLVKEKFLNETVNMKYDFLELDFEIPPQHLDYTTEWSHRNMQLLWEIGYQTGVEWLQQKDKNGKLHRDKLPDREADGPSPANPHPFFNRKG